MSDPNLSDLITYDQVLDYVPLDQDKYADAEIKIRCKLYRLLRQDPRIKSILFSDPVNDTFCPFDAVILSAGTWMLLEGKQRSYRLDQKDSWIIDESKGATLERISSETGLPCVFASITSDDVLLMWDVRSKHSSNRKLCPNQTLSPENGNRVKDLRFYPSDSAQVIR